MKDINKEIRITDILNARIQTILVEYGVHDIVGADITADIATDIEDLLTKQVEEGILENLAQMNIYAMHKKKVYGKDREYFLTVEEMHELTKSHLTTLRKEQNHAE